MGGVGVGCVLVFLKPELDFQSLATKGILPDTGLHFRQQV